MINCGLNLKELKENKVENTSLHEYLIWKLFVVCVIIASICVFMVGDPIMVVEKREITIYYYLKILFKIITI